MSKETYIRMSTSIAGPSFSVIPGQVTNKFNEHEAKRLVDSGQAQSASKKEFDDWNSQNGIAPPKKETATKGPKENTAQGTGKQTNDKPTSK